MALRPWGTQSSDAAALAAGWADPEVLRWTSVPEHHGEHDASRWVAGSPYRCYRGVALDLAITEISTRGPFIHDTSTPESSTSEPVIGEIGLVVVNPERRWAEVGYWLLPAWRDRGRATAALGLFSEWVLDELPVVRLFARTHGENPASAAVARGARYRHPGDLTDGVAVWVRDAEARSR
ncbi:hypothetical protein BH23ACT2_BH23ACT2_03810 [soil metagenome]